MNRIVVANSEGSRSRNIIVGSPSSVQPLFSVVHDYHFVDIRCYVHHCHRLKQWPMFHFSGNCTRGCHRLSRGMPDSFYLLLRMRLVDGSQMQGSLQLHRTSEGSTASDDLQWLLRENGSQRKVAV
ncbi:hypothetical protein ANTQUA_LOCUS4857 [Anthophora quadrimaculata]